MLAGAPEPGADRTDIEVYQTDPIIWPEGLAALLYPAAPSDAGSSG